MNQYSLFIFSEELEKKQFVCVCVCVRYRFKIGMKSVCFHLQKRKIDASNGTFKVTVVKP